MRTHAEADLGGVMVALVPSQDASQRLLEASGGTEPLDQQHVTLAYLGTLGTEIEDSDEARATVFAITAGVASRYAPMNGEVSGCGIFNNEEDALVALWSIPGVNGLRQDLVTRLHDAGHPVKSNYGFTPHQTLGYYEPGQAKIPGRLNPKVKSDFRDLVIAWGHEEWVRVPLTGRTIEATKRIVMANRSPSYTFLPKDDPQALLEMVKGLTSTAKGPVRGGNPDNPGQFSKQDRGYRKEDKAPSEKKPKGSGGTKTLEEGVERDPEDEPPKKSDREGEQSWEVGVAGLDAAILDGGFSMRDPSGVGPKTGYMIALNKETERVFDLDSLTVDDIADYYDEFADLLADDSKYLGGWVDEGKLYLDVSTNMEDLDEVMDLARENDQLAVWDIANTTSVYTKDHFGEGEGAEGEQSVPEREVPEVEIPPSPEGEYTGTSYAEMEGKDVLTKEDRIAVGDQYLKPLPEGKYPEGDPRNEPEAERVMAEKEALVQKHIQGPLEGMSSDKHDDPWYDPANAETIEQWRESGTGGQSRDLFDRRYDPETGLKNIYTPERARAHQQILRDYQQRYKGYPKEGKAVVMAGPPGAGKSTFLDNFGKEQFGVDVSTKEERKAGANPAKNFVTINPDDFKDFIEVDLARYPGLNENELAAIKHEESSYLAKAATQYFMSEGYNVIIDITLGNSASAMKKYYTPWAENYDYSVALVNGDMKNSRNNAGLRWKKPDKETGKRTYSGRFIPMDVIENNAPTQPGYRSKNAEEFLKFIENEKVSKSVVYDPYNPEAGVQPAETARTAKRRLLAAANRERFRRAAARAEQYRRGLAVSPYGNMGAVGAGRPRREEFAMTRKTGSSSHPTTVITEKIRAFSEGQITEDALIEFLTTHKYQDTESCPHKPGTAGWWAWHEDNGYQPGTMDEVTLARDKGLLPWDTFHKFNDAIVARADQRMRQGGTS